VIVVDDPAMGNTRWRSTRRPGRRPRRPHRRDPDQERTLNLWLAGDNLRKGAATNAVQVAELLIERNLLNSGE